MYTLFTFSKIIKLRKFYSKNYKYFAYFSAFTRDKFLFNSSKWKQNKKRIRHKIIVYTRKSARTKCLLMTYKGQMLLPHFSFSLLLSNHYFTCVRTRKSLVVYKSQRLLKIYLICILVVYYYLWNVIFRCYFTSSSSVWCVSVLHAF